MSKSDDGDFRLTGGIALYYARDFMYGGIVSNLGGAMLISAKAARVRLEDSRCGVNSALKIIFEADFMRKLRVEPWSTLLGKTHTSSRQVLRRRWRLPRIPVPCDRRTHRQHIACALSGASDVSEVARTARGISGLRNAPDWQSAQGELPIALAEDSVHAKI